MMVLLVKNINIKFYIRNFLAIVSLCYIIMSSNRKGLLSIKVIWHYVCVVTEGSDDPGGNEVILTTQTHSEETLKISHDQSYSRYQR